jgi:glycogen(starch) synthase
MKILIINSEFPPIGGGAGNASSNIARQMVTKGHSVIHLTTQFKDFPHEEDWHGVKIIRVPAIRKRLDRSSPMEQILYMIGGTWGALRVLKSFEPDVVIAFFGIPSGPIAWLLKGIGGVPYVVSMRGGDVPGFRPYDFKIFHRLIGPFLRVIWRNASALVANSNGLRNLALAFDPSAEIQIIPNGVDLKTFTPVERDWTSPRLLSVGRVVFQKGLDLGMWAMAQIPQLEWKWTIAGDGGYREELEAQAKHLGIADRVDFVGWQSKEQLTALYQQANLFLFPSRHEGMPNAMLEAMASGLPVIASNIAGSEELVVHNKTGLLFPSEDREALKEDLLRLLPDAALRRQMGDASRLRVEDQYSWEEVANRYLTILSEIKGMD